MSSPCGSSRPSKETVRPAACSAAADPPSRLRQNPNDDQRHILLGLALAYLGRKEEAIREGMCGVELMPVAKDSLLGTYDRHVLARIYTLTGEPEKALDHLEPLLKTPYLLSPGWLKIDPNFDPLRQNPRFQQLVRGSA